MATRRLREETQTTNARSAAPAATVVQTITSAMRTLDAGADTESPAPPPPPPPPLPPLAPSLAVAPDVLPSSAAEVALCCRLVPPPTLKTTLGVRTAGNGHASLLSPSAAVVVVVVVVVGAV